MTKEELDRKRGDRLKQAMQVRGYLKSMALAVELDISPAAISKWKQGHAMSIDNACNISKTLDISMDWLLLGRNGPDWLEPGHLNAQELELLQSVRQRPARVTRLLLNILAEIPQK